MLTPVSTISQCPAATRRRTSPSTSSSARERLGPRTSGITQKLQLKEQPSCTFTKARVRSRPSGAGCGPRQPRPASRSPTAAGTASAGCATTCTRSPRSARRAPASRAAQPVTTTCAEPSASARRIAWRVFATASDVTAQPFTTCTCPPACTSCRPSAARRSRSVARSVCDTLQPRNCPENVGAPAVTARSTPTRRPRPGGPCRTSRGSCRSPPPPRARCAAPRP